ncbi:MAG: hydrogenase maturation protease [Anaerolineales bacterium]|jgi:hydrogenase maturation protease
MKTIIVGLGNPILSDDGIGVLCANEIRQHLPRSFEENTVITEASVGGIRLMELLVGYSRAIIIDAIKISNGNKLGTIHKISLSDLRDLSPTQHSSSAHDTSLVTAIDFGTKMGLQLPSEFSIYAIEVDNISDFSEYPNPEVLEAIPEVTRLVIEDLQYDINTSNFHNNS